MYSASLQLSQSTMTTTALPPGIYRIAVVGGVERALLTRHGRNGVTILPPSAQTDLEQEVILRRFLTSSIIGRSPTLLVENRPWCSSGQHHHRDTLPALPNLLPYLQRRSQET
jgi:hypothetical protein